jgi:hypothetical protein
MRSALVAAIVGAWLAGTGAQGLSQQDIASAIEQGLAGKTLAKTCFARGDNGMDISVEGPMGRVMRAAREAKKKKRAFTAADVTERMAGPWLLVRAVRDERLRNDVREDVPPGSVGGFRFRGEMVIKSKPSGSEAPTVLQPVGPVYYSIENTGSRQVVTRGEPATSILPVPMPGSDMEAWFDFAAFKAIPHKDVEITAFMTDTGSHGCKISEKERMALR